MPISQRSNNKAPDASGIVARDFAPFRNVWADRTQLKSVGLDKMQVGLDLDKSDPEPTALRNGVMPLGSDPPSSVERRASSTKQAHGLVVSQLA